MKRLFFFIILAFNIPAFAGLAKPRLVATFSILQDIVKNVAGDGYEVDSIVPLGSDPHIYEIRPGDIKKIINPGDENAAVAVFLIGLGFEGSLKNIVHHSKFSGPVIEVTLPQSEAGHGVKVRLLVEAAKPVADPHVWGSVHNVIVMVNNVRDGLIKASPNNAETFRKNAAAYTAKLTQLEQYISSELAKIPTERRKVVTTHDAFYYYGEAYGVQFLAPIGTSTESEPSARDVSEIIDLVKNEQIKAIFFEKIANIKLVKQIAEETGVEIDPDQDVLYADSLSGPSGPAGTYLDMMYHNTNRMVAKLK